MYVRLNRFLELPEETSGTRVFQRGVTGLRDHCVLQVCMLSRLTDLNKGTYIGVAKSENALNFAELARVFDNITYKTAKLQRGLNFYSK